MSFTKNKKRKTPGKTPESPGKTPGKPQANPGSMRGLQKVDMKMGQIDRYIDGHRDSMKMWRGYIMFDSN